MFSRHFVKSLGLSIYLRLRTIHLPPYEGQNSLRTGRINAMSLERRRQRSEKLCKGPDERFRSQTPGKTGFSKPFLTRETEGGDLNDVENDPFSQ